MDRTCMIHLEIKEHSPDTQPSSSNTGVVHLYGCPESKPDQAMICPGQGEAYQLPTPSDHLFPIQKNKQGPAYGNRSYFIHSLI